MFQWLTELVSPHYDVDEFIEALAPGHRHSLARLDQRRKEEEKQRHEEEVRALKKERLEQELEDAEWILEYEKRLISLQKKLRGNVHKRSSLEPTPTACGNWNTTSQDFAGPSTSVPALSS